MPPGEAGQSDHGVGLDADEAAGLSDAVALGQVLEDSDSGWLPEPAAVQRRALAFGNASATALAIQKSKLLVLAVAAADREIAGVAPAVERTVGIVAAEAGQVVQGVSGLGASGQDGITRWERSTSFILRRIPHDRSTHLRYHPLTGNDEPTPFAAAGRAERTELWGRSRRKPPGGKRWIIENPEFFSVPIMAGRGVRRAILREEPWILAGSLP
jgi:hypothetical protein